MATGFPTKANYAAGDILTAANMNDLSSTVNYLQYAKTQNPVLNSNFAVAQRGTSIAAAASSTPYTLDRWQISTTANEACTVSQQLTSDTTNLPNIKYCARVQRNSGQTGTGGVAFYQSMETINSIPFTGQAVTLSFYARAGANYSAASSTLTAYLFSGTGTDQNIGSYTGQATVASGAKTLTTTWQRFSITGTVGLTATELTPYFNFTPVGTAGTNDYFEITGVQLELGSVANTYQPNGATYQAELAACQRYYYRMSGTTAEPYAVGAANATTSATVLLFLPVVMRTSPTASYSGTFRLEGGASKTGIAAASLATNQVQQQQLLIAVTTSGLTQGWAMSLLSNGTSYMDFSSEL